MPDGKRMVDRATAVIEWLMPFAIYPECICEKTIGCECNVEEAQRNYEPTLEAARQWLREFGGSAPREATHRPKVPEVARKYDGEHGLVVEFEDEKP